MFRSRSLLLAFGLSAGAALAGCSGGGSAPSAPPNAQVPNPSPTAAGLAYQQLVAIPAWKPGVTPSYDISFNNGKFDVLADRTSKAVDVVNDATQQLTTVTNAAFTGFSGNNSTSGPDGVTWDSTHDLFYVGDVNKVVPFNANTLTVGTPITIPEPPNENGSATGNPLGSGNRTDEGCYDPDDQIVMFANNADAPPYASFISTKTGTPTLIAQFQFSADSVGAEQCAYSHSTNSFFINNVGDTAHPGGALAKIPAADIVAAAPGTVLNPTTTAGYAEYDETANGTGCNPAGLAIAANNNILVGCGDVSNAANAFDPASPGYATALQIYGIGKPLHSLIMNTSGQITTVVPYGGSDEVWYDSKKDRFYAAARFWTTTGLSGGTAFTSIGILSSSGSLLGTLPTVGNVHSVAADPNTGNLYVPQQSNSTSQGGISIFTAQ